jgi:hypothetical protein
MIRLWFCLILAISLLASSPALADSSEGEGGGGSAAKKAQLDIVAVPLFGEGTLPPGGWGEVLVRIQNIGTEPREGEAIVLGNMAQRSSRSFTRTSAPFTVGVGAQVSLRIPARVSDYDNPGVRVVNKAGEVLYERTINRADDNRTVLIDVARTSPLGVALSGVAVGSRNDPWAPVFRGYPMHGTGASIVHVGAPIYDAVTGDPLMPRRASSYARVSVLIMRSDELTRLGAEELQALAGWLLGGGTLALVVARQEDLRHPVVAAMLGGDGTVSAQLAPEILAPLTLRPSSGGTPYGSRSAPPIPGAVDEDLRDTFLSYSGGNLHPTPYGSSAPYGLGEVHLLAFDPQKKPAVDSKWVHVRMLDLLRRANERVSGVLFRPGEAHSSAVEVRRQLDPNESSRWSIILVALLLCLYSIVAGPINFTLWRKRGKPLRALVWLPVASAIAFASVVVVGVVAKGCSGRSRHLTMVEAGAGMSKGTARRWRGFFVPTSREMTIRTTNASAVLGSEQMSSGDEAHDHLRLDRDGLRLEELNVRPWETLVVREDGYTELGDGVALIGVSPSETQIVNRTGRRLRALVLSDPSGTQYFHPALEDGQSVTSSAMTPVLVSSGSSGSGTLPILDFNVFSINDELDEAADGLSDAWTAITDAMPVRKSWFLDTVPVLLAQIDGGEGTTSDSGLRVDSDRVLLRVVGYGGRP